MQTNPFNKNVCFLLKHTSKIHKCFYETQDIYVGLRSKKDIYS